MERKDWLLTALVFLSLSSGIPRNASSVSLSDQERAGTPFGVAPKAILLQRRPHTGEAEFLGLTLPVDINMMFEVQVVHVHIEH